MRSGKIISQAAVALSLAVGLVGCASIQSPVPPSLELPRPPNDLRAVRKGDHVYLFWSVPTQTMDHQTVRRPGPTRVCRSLELPMNSCGLPVGNLLPVTESANQKPGASAARPEANFGDTLPRELQEHNADRMATYAVEPLNRSARSAGLSNRVLVGLAPTLPPPQNFSVEVTAAGPVLTWNWTPPAERPANVSYVCRIDRRLLERGTDTKLADVDCAAQEYHDPAAEWEKNYEYRITVVTSEKVRPGLIPCARNQGEGGVIAIPDCVQVVEIEGDDSLPQKVFTKDVYPPAVPSGLQAVFSGPGQAPFIDLLWAPDTDADLAGYNVYRREDGGQPTKINLELVKTPAYRDAGVVAGKTYWYAVSAVDARGNESGLSGEASESVPSQ